MPTIMTFTENGEHWYWGGKRRQKKRSGLSVICAFSGVFEIIIHVLLHARFKDSCCELMNYIRLKHMGSHVHEMCMRKCDDCGGLIQCAISFAFSFSLRKGPILSDATAWLSLRIPQKQPRVFEVESKNLDHVRVQEEASISEYKFDSSF